MEGAWKLASRLSQQGVPYHKIQERVPADYPDLGGRGAGARGGVEREVRPVPIGADVAPVEAPTPKLTATVCGRFLSGQPTRFSFQESKSQTGVGLSESIPLWKFLRKF